MNSKIRLLKLLDLLIGNLLLFIVPLLVTPRRDSEDKKNIKKNILIIRPGGVGDAVLLYPALKALRQHFPDSAIDVLSEKRNCGIFEACPYVNEVYVYEDFSSLFYILFDSNYDIVIDTEQWHKLSAVVSYITRAPVRVGFGTNSRKMLFSHVVEYGQKRYEARSFLDLVSVVTDKKHHFRHEFPFFVLDSEDGEVFDSILKRYRAKYKALVGMFMGATVKERRWGIINFALLADRLFAKDFGVILFGAPSDATDSRILNRILFDRDVLDLVGKTSLSDVGCIMSKLDLFVSSDTGLMHMAYGKGVRTVSLFGAGNQKKWAPVGEKHIVINKSRFCSPCTSFGYTPKCRYDVRCLRDITVDEVYEACIKLLDVAHKEGNSQR